MQRCATPTTTRSASAWKTNHDNSVGYGTAVYSARQLGLTSVARVLNGILDEEKNANGILNNLAKNIINARAE